MMHTATKLSYTCAATIFLFANLFAQDPDFHIYLCFGRSNMCGAGAIEAQDRTVDSRLPTGFPNRSRTFGKWNCR